MDLMSEYRQQKKQSDTLIASLTSQLEIANLQNKYLDDKIVLLNQIVELKKEIRKNDPFGFDAFCRARVRVGTVAGGGWNSNQASLKDLWLSYTNHRLITEGGKKATKEEFTKRAEDVFGKPERPLYQDTPLFKGVYVFWDDEGVAEFDRDPFVSRD
jgi:hypothetical protein